VSESILADGRQQSIVRDITERRAAEEESRRSRARIEGIISIATDAIISIDEEQRITLFNRGAEQIFGWSEREALGQPLDILIPDRFRVIHRSHVNGFAAEGMHARTMGARDRHIYGLRKDGAVFPAEAAISKLQIGDEITFTIVLRDTTERGNLERELRDARSFLENVLDSSTEYGIVALDLDRRIVLWNEGARRSYGYSAQEIEGTSADGLHVPSDIASGVAHSLYARALDQGSAEAVLFRRHKNGSEFLAHVVASRRIATDGEPSGYLLISRDVTREHRRSEQQRLLAAVGPLLTSSLDRMQVLGSAEELLVREFADVCIVDLEDSPEGGPPVEQRKVAHRDPRRRALSLALEAIRLDQQRPHLTWACLQTNQTILVSHVTLEYLDSIAQGEEHRRLLRELAPVSLISVPLTARGLLLGAITLVSSDPRRRYDEDDAALAEDIGRRLAMALDNARLFGLATKAVAARDEVLGIVAHDLRNPLGTILMQATLLRHSGPELARQLQKPAETIERAVTRMNRLIQDLLDVTRMEAGRLSVELARVSAGQVVSDSVEAQRSLAASAALELRLDVARELPDVWADCDRLLQVFENLIGNAVKFSKPGGQIVVGAVPREGDVLFWVADTGAGIPSEDLPHVFDRFWQARKAERRGAGLGLPIVKGIVEAHGGRIWVESTPNRGSTFFFTIPTAPSGRMATGLSTTQPVTRSAAGGQNEKGLDG
jgi:PAS domain S-box-containing protein